MTANNTLWRARVAKALPRGLSGERRNEMLAKIFEDVQYAATTEIVLPAHLEKLKRANSIAKQFKSDLEKTQSKLVDRFDINPKGGNKRTPWADLYKITHDATVQLARWTHMNRHDGRRKETAPWLREQLKFWYCYYGGRRGWQRLFKAVDEAEHLRIGLNEARLPTLAKKSKSRKHPR